MTRRWSPSAQLARLLGVVLVLVLVPASALAGCSCEAIYMMPHVVYQAGIFGGDCTVPPMKLLEARGMALLLEEHVAAKIARGELPDKRLQVTRMNDDWGTDNEPLCVSQNRKSWFIEGAQSLDLRNLLRAIDDFGSPAWTSFCPDVEAARRRCGECYGEKLHAPLAASFAKVLDGRIAEPDVEAFRARQVTVAEVGALKVIFQYPSLFYELEGARLAIVPQGFVPVRVGERYVLQDGKAIVAIEHGEVVASHALPGLPEWQEDCSYLPLAEAHATWVNIFCWHSGSAVLSYSLEQNRFHAVNVRAHPRRTWGGRRDPQLVVIPGC